VKNNRNLAVISGALFAHQKKVLCEADQMVDFTTNDDATVIVDLVGKVAPDVELTEGRDPPAIHRLIHCMQDTCMQGFYTRREGMGSGLCSYVI
jgi:hypothetical protein